MTAHDPHVFELLERAMGALRAEMLVRREDLQHEGDRLRPSQYRLLDHVPAEGARIGDLAATLHISPQAIGEFVRELETLGMVVITSDPADRRARLVRLTDQGREAAAAALAGVRGLERSWRRRLGAAEWDHLCDTLARIVE